MKKEMLEQAVLDYISEKFKDKVVDKRVQTFFTYSELVDTVFSFAELLNKNIEELEKELSISEHDREHNDYELLEVYKKVEKLEKENTELKAVRQDCIKLTEDNVVMAEQRAEVAKQLTKAKEIIKELLDTQSQLDPYRDIFKDRILKAEQFLQEK